MLSRPIYILSLYLLGVLALIFFFWEYIVPFPYSLSLSERNYLNSKKSILFVSDIDFPPFSFHDEKIAMSLGYEPDLVNQLKQIFDQTGVTIRFDQYSWDKCTSMFNNGQIDVLNGLCITNNRKRYYSFTHPYINASFSVTTLKESIYLKPKLELLSKHTFVVQKGSITEDLLKDIHLPESRIIYGAGPTECLQKLIKGEADIWLEFQSVASNLIRTTSTETAFNSITLQGLNAPYAMAVNKEDKILADILNKVFINLNNSGFFTFLDQKWFGINLTRDIPSVKTIRSIALSIFFIYTIIFVFLYWNSLLRKRIYDKTEEISNLYHRVSQSLEDTLNMAAAAIDARDSYTAQHSKMVANYAATLAMHMRLPREILYNIYTASLFHDIGKIAMPDRILQKKGALTDDEYNLIKEHCQHGARILNQSRGAIADLSQMIYSHHERYDGGGYPEGTKLRDIPISIIVFADAFDAMTSARPYREPLSSEAVLDEITRGAGRQFHPLVVAYFKELLENYGSASDVYTFVTKIKQNSYELHKKIATNLF